MPLPTVDTVTHPRAAGYGARVDDLYLRLAPGARREFVLGFDQLQAQRVDTAVNSEELVSEFGQVFARDDFTGGEGQDRAHRRFSDTDQTWFTRYWASEGVEIKPRRGGAPAEVCLLYAGERLYSAASLGSPVAFDGKLFAKTSADPQLLLEITNPTTTISTATTNPHNGEATSGTTHVSDPVALGDYLYVGIGTNGVHRRQVGTSTWAHFSDVRVSRLWTAQGKIFGSYEGTLYEVRTAAASVTLHTLLAGGAGRWDMVADGAGRAILAAASATASTQSILHSFTPDDTGALELVAQSDQPDREMIADLVSVQGVIFFTTVPDVTGTAPGKIWFATLADSFTLADIQLLKDFDTLTELSSGRKLTADGSYVYVGSLTADFKPVIWKLDAITLGVHRSTSFPNAGSSSATYPPDPLYAFGRMFLTDAGGLHRVSVTDYVSTGYLISPLADFGTAAVKEWVGASLAVQAVQPGTEVELWYSTNPEALMSAGHTSWRRAKRITSGTDDFESALSNATGAELTVKLVLTTGTSTMTPCARGFSVRGYPSEADMIIEMPVDVSDTLDRPGKAAIRSRQRGHVLYRTLNAMQGADAVLELLDIGITLRGLVETVTAPIVTRSTRGSQTFYAVLRFRGRVVSSVTDLQLAGEGTLGITTLGKPPALGMGL